MDTVIITPPPGHNNDDDTWWLWMRSEGGVPWIRSLVAINLCCSGAALHPMVVVDYKRFYSDNLRRREGLRG